MPERAPNGILRTQPLYTEPHVDVPARTGGEANGDDGGATCAELGLPEELPFEWADAIGEVLATVSNRLRAGFTSADDALRADVLKKLAELENKLAEMRGALDVLRGKGMPGLPNVRGTYRATESYSALDIVALDGGSFVARRDAPGPCPGSGWQLLCQKGARGPRGERGERGYSGVAPTWTDTTFDSARLEWVPRMSDGTHGAPISAKPLLYGIEVDAKNYSLVFRSIDGTGITVNLRPLFEQFVAEVRGSQQGGK